MNTKLEFLAHALFCKECNPEISVSMSEGGSWPNGCRDADTYHAILEKPWKWELCLEGNTLMVTAINGEVFTERFGGSSMTKCDSCKGRIGYDGERWTGGIRLDLCAACCLKRRTEAIQ
jgi:hypothetical protein